MTKKKKIGVTVVRLRLHRRIFLVVHSVLAYLSYVCRINENSLCWAAANTKYIAGNFYGASRIFLADNTDQFNRLRCAISRENDTTSYVCVWMVWCGRLSNENEIKIPNDSMCHSILLLFCAAG